jgi:hypothetical protein
MRAGDRSACLQHPVDRLLERQRAARLQLGLEVATVQQLHDHVRPAVRIRVDVEDVGDVRSPDPANGARFSLEPLDCVRHGGHVGSQPLDCHALHQAQVLGLEDNAHPSLAEQPRNTVLAAHYVTHSGWGRLDRSCLLERD